jgi:hypothetical protein
LTEQIIQEVQYSYKSYSTGIWKYQKKRTEKKSEAMIIYNFLEIMKDVKTWM